MSYRPSMQQIRRIRPSMWVKRPDPALLQQICRHEQMEMGIGDHEFSVVCLDCLANLGGGKSNDLDAVLSEWVIEGSAI